MKYPTMFLSTIVLLMLMSSCGVKLHKAFPYTGTSVDVYKNVSNDSAGVRFSGAADIDYLTDEDKARTFLKKEWDLNAPDNILFVGASNIEPFYSFIILMDCPEEFDHPDYQGIKIHSFQRRINGHRIDLIARGKEANLRPDDFEYILDNMSIQ